MGIPTSGPMLEFQNPGEKGNFTHHSAELRMRIDGLRYDGSVMPGAKAGRPAAERVIISGVTPARQPP
jgi:hypothetical protein